MNEINEIYLNRIKGIIEDQVYEYLSLEIDTENKTQDWTCDIHINFDFDKFWKDWQPDFERILNDFSVSVDIMISEEV